MKPLEQGKIVCGMFIAKRVVIIVWVIICVITAIFFTQKAKKSPNWNNRSEIEDYLKTFIFYLVLCLLTTPIVAGIYNFFEKKFKS